MRVNPQIGAAQIQSIYRPESTDRFVRINVFAPLSVSWKSVLEEMAENDFWDWAIETTNDARGDKFGVFDKLNKQSAWHQALIQSPFAKLSTWVSAPSDLPPLSHDNKDFKIMRERIAALQTSLPKPNVDFRSNHGVLGWFQGNRDSPQRLQDANVAALLVNVTNVLDYGIVKAPPGSSEIGFMFLDRTRVRAVGIEVGEIFDSVPLIPGQEAIYEVRTSHRQTYTVEDAIEKEYELTLEQSDQATETKANTLSTQDSLSRGKSTTVDARGEAKLDPVPVDASLGVSDTNTFNTAANNAEQVSISTATTTTSKVSSRLKQNHKVSLKRETEDVLELSTRSTLRNANAQQSLTVHYFKLLQRLEFTHQRTGVRLCWAPFVFDPGADLRMRALTSRNMVLATAEAAVRMPKSPAPPKKEFVPTWVAGNTFTIPVGGRGVHLFSFPTAIIGIQLKADDSFFGKVRITLGGTCANAASYSDPEITGPNEEGWVKAKIDIQVGLVFSRGVLEVTAEFEVVRALPNYEEKFAEYHQLLRDYENETTRLRTLARGEAMEEADNALQDVISKATLSDELTAAVLAQIVYPLGVRPEEIELWHRLFQFEEMSFVSYPGWWRPGTLPWPQLGPRHFVNLSIARVFLPVRPGYEKLALEKILSSTNRDAAKFDPFCADIEAKLKEANEPLRSELGIVPKTLAGPWYNSVPTQGAHIEMEVGVSESLDPAAQQQLQSTLDRLIEEISAIREENRVRAMVVGADATQVSVGPLNS
jgi:hypothetical protein